ncbi:uncharacterized protein N7511_005162 [Penicillium nucicola]|uniref:uncharacterized protein n=1 Tax=Penicillium nucicola TaxID=1850975 RepID=UPI0025456534|nr:uncharacterized protein N7511_005162 [Penicillium nucicola]KAJ5761780.1 hypothetical protein N7511_005162 [Penicillium nucicola]
MASKDELELAFVDLGRDPEELVGACLRPVWSCVDGYPGPPTTASTSQNTSISSLEQPQDPLGQGGAFSDWQK